MLRFLALTLALSASLSALPDGFKPLFNGKDLSGWWGAATEDPSKYLALPPEQLAEKKKKSLNDIRQHWAVKDSIIHNDGHGLFLTTEKNFADFELRLEYKLDPKADSGIYLRGIPQVQIWDTTKETSPALKHGAAKGSGGLWNNPAGSPGKDPLVHADKPLGQWNAMTVRLIGEKVTVILNGKTVVDQAKLHNYFDKKGPLPASGPIQLQTHGAPMQWRNIFIKEL
ncbi:MAG: 3-keto-disaccharide hydrolase [Verrucomicrobiaceae bacterium]